MESYVNDPNTQQILKSSVIEWYKEIEEFKDGHIGDISF